MAYSVWQNYIVDDTGAPVASPSIEVRKESDGTLATIYSSDAGAALANPFTGTAAGLARFYVAGGIYKVEATSGALTTTFRYVQIGEAQSYDVGTASGELITKSTADGLYVAQATGAVLLVDCLTETTQTPTATDTPMKVTWNETSVDATDVVVRGEDYGTAGLRGNIVFQTDGFYLIEANMYIDRAASASDLKWITAKHFDGAYIDPVEVTILQASLDHGVMYKDRMMVEISGAPKTLYYHCIRDSSGANSGRLTTFNPVLTGVPTVPAASLKIWKVFSS